MKYECNGQVKKCDCNYCSDSSCKCECHSKVEKSSPEDQDQE